MTRGWNTLNTLRRPAGAPEVQARRSIAHDQPCAPRSMQSNPVVGLPRATLNRHKLQRLPKLHHQNGQAWAASAMATMATSGPGGAQVHLRDELLQRRCVRELAGRGNPHQVLVACLRTASAHPVGTRQVREYGRRAAARGHGETVLGWWKPHWQSALMRREARHLSRDRQSAAPRGINVNAVLPRALLCRSRRGHRPDRRLLMDRDRCQCPQ
mmetsp:Transcript_16286/g.47633  ORF Transcript_16286/g.47633 Transcript_16286/m.47633 type:complete len:213 (-) Transcript_16286:735-1373(-)